MLCELCRAKEIRAGGCFLEGCERRTKCLCKLKLKFKLTKHIGWLQQSSTPWEEIQAPFGFLFVIAPWPIPIASERHQQTTNETPQHTVPKVVPGGTSTIVCTYLTAQWRFRSEALTVLTVRMATAVIERAYLIEPCVRYYIITSMALCLPCFELFGPDRWCSTGYLPYSTLPVTSDL